MVSRRSVFLLRSCNCETTNEDKSGDRERRVMAIDTTSNFNRHPSLLTHSLFHRVSSRHASKDNNQSELPTFDPITAKRKKAAIVENNGRSLGSKDHQRELPTDETNEVDVTIVSKTSIARYLPRQNWVFHLAWPLKGKALAQSGQRHCFQVQCKTP